MKTMKYYLWLLMATFVFAACEDDNDDLNAEHGLTAVAGSDQEVNIGETVTLSAAASIDLHGEGFSVQWSFVSTPSGSSVSISNAGNSSASFVPDVQGDYLVELTISNEMGEDSDGLMVTALDAGTKEISGNYSDDLHLTKRVDDPETPDYVVTNTLSMTARLTIDPGVRIHVASDNLIRIRQDGIIEANGTASEPIIITGTTQLPGFWRGLLVESNNLENELNHVHISASGSNNIATGQSRTALHVSSARVKLNSCHFINNDGYGLTVSSADSRIPMQNNYFDNNSLGAAFITAGQIRDVDTETDFGNDDIRISGTTLNTNAEHTWRAALNGNYRFTSNLSIFDEIVIEEGAVFTADNDVFLRFYSDAVVRMQGTENNPIVFKGTIEQPGSWRGIVIESSDLNNRIEHVHFSHAGHSNLMVGYDRAALGFSSGARAGLSNVHFSEIQGYGIFMRYEATRVTFENLSFGSGISVAAAYMRPVHLYELDTQSNWGGYHIEVNGGSVPDTEDVVWPKLNDGMYLFTGTTTIYGKLTLQPGSILEFDNDALFRVRTNGVFVANGTPSDHIILRNKTGSAAHWKGIAIETSSLENSMEYVEVSHGGNSSLITGIGATNIGVGNNARLKLHNSIIRNSLGFGIIVRGSATLDESNNTFSGNVLGDIDYL